MRKHSAAYLEKLTTDHNRALAFTSPILHTNASGSGNCFVQLQRKYLPMDAPGFLFRPNGARIKVTAMRIDQRVIDRLSSLIAEGVHLLGTTQANSGASRGNQHVDTQLATKWRASCRSFLQRIFDEKSTYFSSFDNRVWSVSTVEYGLGVLHAAKEDYEQGYLFDVRLLIEAEVFDDILEQAEHLLESGYGPPAAVMGGGILEDALRRLCVAKGIPLADKPKLDKMNADLAKAGTYNKLMQKRITALADIRNSAAHGEWAEFTDDDVQNMLQHVRGFLEQHFS